MLRCWTAKLTGDVWTKLNYRTCQNFQTSRVDSRRRTADVLQREDDKKLTSLLSTTTIIIDTVRPRPRCVCVPCT